MDLLGGYGSDGSGDSGEEDAQPSAPKPKTSKPPAGGASSSEGSTGKRKVIDFSKLPVRRPLVLDDSDLKGEADEAPLRKAAQLESMRGGFLSLLAALPPPKVTLGIDVDPMGSGSRIDLSEVRPDRKRPAPNVLNQDGGIMRGGVSAPDVHEDEVPQDMLNHPMFRKDGEVMDRPSAEDLHQMKSMKFIKAVKAEDVQDPNWYMNNQMSGGLGLGAGKKVTQEVSMYEKKDWEKTTHAAPSKVQKKKHQINWMAHEAMEMEAEMLDRNASSRLTKSQTSMKYGW